MQRKSNTVLIYHRDKRLSSSGEEIMSSVIRRHFNTDIHSRCKHTSPVSLSQSDGYLMALCPDQLNSITTLETLPRCTPSRQPLPEHDNRACQTPTAEVFNFPRVQLLAPTSLTLRLQSCDWQLHCPGDESLGQRSSFLLIGRWVGVHSFSFVGPKHGVRQTR